jgi:Tfp pilus assembly protein PilE
MKLRSISGYRQNGLSMVGFLFVMVIVALVAVLAMKVVPTAVEFMAIKKAIVTAKASGTTAREIQESFEKQRTTAYIDSVTGKDLEITKTGDGFEVDIAYQKKIELVGPASLVLDYVASTSKTPVIKPAQ